jgi:hypothetical protein
VTSAWLSTLIDQEQIELTGLIGPHAGDVESMPDRTGADVAKELGGRLLLRYLVESQLTAFLDGSDDRDHWVTPTAISPSDVISWLALFAPNLPRRHALLLDPAKIPTIRGPAWIRLGSGLEYYLPSGFPKDAILDVGHVKVR